MFRSSFFQVVAMLGAAALIVSGLLMSNDLEHRRVRPTLHTPAPLVDPEPPSPIPDAPDADKVADEIEDVQVESLDAWVSLCRGKISRFPPGTPEYDRFGRMLRRLFRTESAHLQASARMLLEDPTLEPFTQALIIEAIARSEDANRADAVLRGLLCHESTGESLKAAVLVGFASARKVSEETLQELFRIARVPDSLGSLALETLGRLDAASAEMSESMKRSLARCVNQCYDEHLKTGDAEGIRSSVKALALLTSTESQARVQAALKHATPAFRSAAIRAWSSIEASNRRRVLLELLAAEREPSVRVDLVEGLYPLPGSRMSKAEDAAVLEPLATLCREDGDERVRHAALGFFARRFDRANPPPERAVDSIRTVLLADASATNREYASWILRDRCGIER